MASLSPSSYQAAPEWRHASDDADDADDAPTDLMGRPLTGSNPAPRSISRLPDSIGITSSRWNDEGATPARMADRREASFSAGRGSAAEPGSVELDNVSYRWAVGTAQSALSIGAGAAAYRVQPSGTNAGAGLSTGATLPSLSVGLHHHFSDKYLLDVQAVKAAAIGSPLSNSLTSTRVKVEWQPARNTGIGLEQGSLNLRMGSSGKFAMKVRRGGPMFYMRSKF